MKENMPVRKNGPTGDTADSASTAVMPNPSDVTPPIDWVKAIERVLGDEALIKLLIEEFMGNLGAEMAEIHQALAAGRAEELGRNAHRLKGSAATLSMERLAEIAFLLEKQGESGQLDSAADLVRQLELEAERVKAFVSAHDWTHVGA